MTETPTTEQVEEILALAASVAAIRYAADTITERNFSDQRLYLLRDIDRLAPLVTSLATELLALRKRVEWQDISTAPKDGTRILLAKIVGHPAHPTALWWAVAGHWSIRFSNWNDGAEPAGLAGPTHWMPLSTPKEPS